MQTCPQNGAGPIAGQAGPADRCHGDACLSGRFDLPYVLVTSMYCYNTGRAMAAAEQSSVMVVYASIVSCT